MKRIAFIDQLKGIAIFLVVLGHLVGHNAGRDNFLWTFIYSFHMPLFMFISGYLASVTSGTEPLGWRKIGLSIRKKCRTLLLPPMIWGIAIPAILFSNTSFSWSLFSNYLQIWGGGLWFFNTLFILSLLFLLYKGLLQLTGKQGLGLHLLIVGGFCCVLLMANRYMPQGIYSEGIRSVASYSLFYFGGVLVGQFNRLGKLLFDVRVFSLFLILFCCLFPSFVYDMSSWKNQVMKVLLGYCFIPCMFYMVVNIPWNKYVDKMFQYFGRESLAIYVTHNGPFAFLLTLSGTLPVLSSVDLFTASLFISISLLICFLSAEIKKMLSLSPILDFILYGKPWRKRN